MKKMNTRAFTLIEIMIVIAIISLLAVTLVPKLTGAQARSRDASRTSSLVQMKAVLTAYYDDYSEYPKNPHDKAANDGTGGDYCLSEDNKGGLLTDSPLDGYVEGNKTSFDPQKNNIVANCSEPGSYGYVSLSKNGSTNAAFVLSAQTETYQKSNTINLNPSTTVAALGKIGDKELNGTEFNAAFSGTTDLAALKSADKIAQNTTIYTVTGG